MLPFTYHDFLTEFLIMGILGLSKLLADFAPSAIKDNSIKSYFGKLEIVHTL